MAHPAPRRRVDPRGRPLGARRAGGPRARPAGPPRPAGGPPRAGAAPPPRAAGPREGRPGDDIAQAIDAINEARAPVVSVDVPSGVDASTGVVAGAAVRAAATVTFHAAKPGLWIAPGKEHAGEVRVADIGIPRGAPLSAPVGLLTSAALARLPTRAAGWTKFTSGHVVVAGGSRGLAGAPQMTARASMRAGAGYVTLCVTRSLQDAIAAAGWPELMTRGP